MIKQIKAGTKVGKIVRFRRYDKLDIQLCKSLNPESQTRSIIEAVVEQIINFTPKYGDAYEIEVFKVQQRLKAKEIITNLFTDHVH